MNHHRTFFAYIGLVMVAAWLTRDLYVRTLEVRPQLAPAVIAAAVVLVLAHGSGAYVRNGVWDSEESLWFDVTQKSPKNGRGLMNYGLTQMRKARYDEAIGYFEAARKTSYGSHPYISLNLGVAHGAKGDAEEAERFFKEALAQGPNSPECLYYYARWLHQNDRHLESREKIERALTLSPAHLASRKLQQTLKIVTVSTVAEAERLAEEFPSSDSYVQLSLVYYRSARYDDAIIAAQQALEQGPSARAHNNICAANNALKRWSAAEQACTEALRLNPNFKLARANLNWARRFSQESSN